MSATPGVENPKFDSAGKCHLLFFVVVSESLNQDPDSTPDPNV